MINDLYEAYKKVLADGGKISFERQGKQYTFKTSDIDLVDKKEKLNAEIVIERGQFRVEIPIIFYPIGLLGKYDHWKFYLSDEHNTRLFLEGKAFSEEPPKYLTPSQRSKLEALCNGAMIGLVNNLNSGPKAEIKVTSDILDSFFN